jgi:hypothetical protein
MLIRYSFEKNQVLLQLLKASFTSLKEEGAVGVVDYCIAANASAHSDLTTLGTLRNFIEPDLFVEEVVENLSYVHIIYSGGTAFY